MRGIPSMNDMCVCSSFLWDIAFLRFSDSPCLLLGFFQSTCIFQTFSINVSLAKFLDTIDLKSVICIDLPPFWWRIHWSVVNQITLFVPCVSKDNYVANTVKELNKVHLEGKDPGRKCWVPTTLEILLVPSSRLKLHKKSPKVLWLISSESTRQRRGRAGRFARALWKGQIWPFKSRQSVGVSSALNDNMSTARVFFRYFWLAGNMKTDRLTR